MLHKEFFGFLFLGFVAWIFLAASPTQRIENVCRPVAWVGNGTTSLTSLVVPNQQTKIQGWFDKVEYGCRFVTWRLFYQDAYNQWLATQNMSTDGKSAVAPASAPAATPAGASVPVAAASAPAVPPPVKK